LETSQIILLSFAFTDLVLIGMAVIRTRQRRLHWFDASAWLLLSLIIPYLGPFLAIIQRADTSMKEIEQNSSENKAR
jgi:uncharacterized membrane protein YhaH (DUF805 family)